MRRGRGGGWGGGWGGGTGKGYGMRKEDIIWFLIRSQGLCPTVLGEDGKQVVGDVVFFFFLFSQLQLGGIR